MPQGPPQRDLSRVAAAQRRLEAAVGDLTDQDVAAPSLLPGWTVGHVLTHLARNADSHLRRSAAAARGELAEQYPGGASGRSAEIEDGAARPAGELLDDVRASAAALADCWAALPVWAWDGSCRDVSGQLRQVRELPVRRWQELEIHLVDLGIGVTPEHWSSDFVTALLPPLQAGLADRLAPGVAVPDLSGLTERDQLAWLCGRAAPAGLPELAPW